MKLLQEALFYCLITLYGNKHPLTRHSMSQYKYYTAADIFSITVQFDRKYQKLLPKNFSRFLTAPIYFGVALCNESSRVIVIVIVHDSVHKQTELNQPSNNQVARTAHHIHEKFEIVVKYHGVDNTSRCSGLSLPLD